MAARLLVVGGGAAGMSAASAAKRTDPDTEVVVAEATGHAAWGLCGLPYYLAGLVEEATDLEAYPASFFREERDIDLRLHTRVVDVDAAAHRAVLEDTDGRSEVAYDTLVVAAGGSAIRPPLPGVDHEHVFALRHLEEARRLRALLDDGALRTVLVVGAGYIGLEVAEALVERGCDVVVVEALDGVLPTVDPPLAALVEDEVRTHTDLRLGARLVGLRPATGRIEADIGTERVTVDAVVLGVGVRPRAHLLAETGVATTPGGALLVDDRQRTSLQDVLAAGDCVAPRHLVTGRPAYVPLGPAANKMGRVAGTVAAGGDARFPGVVGTAAVKVFDLTIARTGLTLAEAIDDGFDAVATDVTARSRAKYYPGSHATHVRLVHRTDGRLLGAQMVSRDPSTAKRIDVVATALYAGLGVAELGELDLSYAPPYAPVYDPVLIAAQAAQRRTREHEGAAS